jgi:hypothetical protein
LNRAREEIAIPNAAITRINRSFAIYLPLMEVL